MTRKLLPYLAWLGFFAAVIVYTAWISRNPGLAYAMSMVHVLLLLSVWDKPPHLSREPLQRFFGLLMGTLAPYLSIYSRSPSEIVVLSAIAVGSIILYGWPATPVFSPKQRP